MSSCSPSCGPVFALDSTLGVDLPPVLQYSVQTALIDAA